MQEREAEAFEREQVVVATTVAVGLCDGDGVKLGLAVGVREGAVGVMAPLLVWDPVQLVVPEGVGEGGDWEGDADREKVKVPLRSVDCEAEGEVDAVPVAEADWVDLEGLVVRVGDWDRAVAVGDWDGDESVGVPPDPVMDQLRVRHGDRLCEDVEVGVREVGVQVDVGRVALAVAVPL